MNINAARRLDYYVGVPLCWMGTVVRRLVSLLVPVSRRKQQPRNILFIELSEMGSALLADPAMRKVKTSLNANLFFMIFRTNRPSLDLLDTVPGGNIFTMRDSGVLAVAGDAVRFFFWTRKHKIDTVIDLELFSRFTALLAALSGALRKVGFHAFHSEGLYRGDFLTHKVAYNPHQHIAKNFVALANALLSDHEEQPYSKTLIPDSDIALQKVAVSEQAKGMMLKKIGALFPDFDSRRHHLVLFNTNASDLVPLRRWPQEHYVKLAGMILERYPAVVMLLTGSSAEHAEKESLLAVVNSKRCLNFAGHTSIAELPVLYSVSACMLTNDSGPAQFAAVTEMPLYVFFGPETPSLYGPLCSMTALYAGLACSPCVSAANHRESACRDNICLTMISPEQVFETLRPRLDALAPMI